MHELSVCQALLAQVAEIARPHAACVERITIEVGPLSGVDPKQLHNAFEVMKSGGRAAASALVIKTVAVRVECLTCAAQCAVRPSRLVCEACGGFRTRIIAGDELRLLRVEMRAGAPPVERLV